MIHQIPLQINIGNFVNKIYFQRTGGSQLGFTWVKIYYLLNGELIIPTSDLSIDDSNTTYPPSDSLMMKFTRKYFYL